MNHIMYQASFKKYSSKKTNRIAQINLLISKNSDEILFISTFVGNFIIICLVMTLQTLLTTVHMVDRATPKRFATILNSQVELSFTKVMATCFSTDRGSRIEFLDLSKCGRSISQRWWNVDLLWKILNVI